MIRTEKMVGVPPGPFLGPSQPWTSAGMEGPCGASKEKEE